MTFSLFCEKCEISQRNSRNFETEMREIYFLPTRGKIWFLYFHSLKFPLWPYILSSKFRKNIFLTILQQRIIFMLKNQLHMLNSMHDGIRASTESDRALFFGLRALNKHVAKMHHLCDSGRQLCAVICATL